MKFFFQKTLLSLNDGFPYIIFFKNSIFGNNRDPCFQKVKQSKGSYGQGHLLRFSGPAWPSSCHWPMVVEYDTTFQNAFT